MLLASLVLAAVANAPIVGPEIASTPVQPFLGQVQPAAPLVTDGDGFLLAFNVAGEGEKGRTLVMRLDSRAEAIPGTARELPALEPSADAELPSLAVAPNGYFVAQTEVAAHFALVVVWHLDRNLNPDPSPFSVLAKSINSPLMAPGLVRVDGGHVFVIADDLVAEYDLGGALLGYTRGNFAADDAGFADGVLVTAGVVSAPSFSRFPCTIGSICVPPTPAHFDTFVSFFGAISFQHSYPTFNPDGIAVAAAGSTAIDIFDLNGEMEFQRYDALARSPIDIAPKEFAAFATLQNDPPQRPFVAFDGVRWVAVWRTFNGIQHAIGAAAIDRDGNVTPINLPNLADETAPFVVAAGPNRFVVSYLSRRDGEYRIAGRFITFIGRRPVVGR